MISPLEKILDGIAAWVVSHGAEGADRAAVAAMVALFVTLCLIVYIFVLRFRAQFIQARRARVYAVWRPLLHQVLTLSDDFDEVMIFPAVKKNETADLIDLIKHMAIRVPIPMRRRLKKVSDAAGLTNTFLRRLESKSSWDRAGAALLCGYVRVTEAIPNLLEMLKDEDPLVVYDAARALGMMGEPRVVREVVSVICKQKGWSRAKIIELLLEFGPDVAMETLRQFLSGNVAPNWMRPMVEIMGHFRVIEARPALEAVVRGNDEEMAFVAITALGRIGMPSSDWVLRGCLKHPSAQIRRAAAVAIGACMATKAEHDLIDMLSDPDVSVRQAAAGALLGFGEKSRRMLWEVSARPGRVNLARDTAAWVLQRASWTAAV